MHLLAGAISLFAAVSEASRAGLGSLPRTVRHEARRGCGGELRIAAASALSGGAPQPERSKSSPIAVMYLMGPNA
jgi:hypothetical protein